MQRILKKIIQSWATTDSKVTPNEEILKWIAQKNRDTCVDIKRISLHDMNDWFYSVQEGVLRNQKGSFFKVSGFCTYCNGEIVGEQPIILQPENGYLGIICKEISGVIHFLMQAKIEPGNINKIQISPTIQATKSNFTQLHGGKKPPYLDYFLHADRYQIVVDQLQSEQSARFLKKRNRNIIIYVTEEVEQLDSHRWMTLGQIKELMCQYDNLVNMDTRTVLSCIPYWLASKQDSDYCELQKYFLDETLFRSIIQGSGHYQIPNIYNYINNVKMFGIGEHALIPLHELRDWEMDETGIYAKKSGGFQVIYCQIEIEGREVRKWTQPLFQATEISTFALVCCDIDGIRYFIVRAVQEPGCFDAIELGPSIQLDVAVGDRHNDWIERLLTSSDVEIICDVLLSEEGGRFYHEQNRNLILKIPSEKLQTLPKGCFLVDYYTLNHMCQINNCLNIQLRNLLSLLRIQK